VRGRGRRWASSEGAVEALQKHDPGADAYIRPLQDSAYEAAIRRECGTRLSQAEL
jgi:hypothetical protein